MWVREGARPLPCRYVITSRDIPGAPQFTVQIVNWDVAPKVADGRFRFVPPSDARTVDFLPTAAAR
jgi:hypothetical protein